MIQKWDRGQEKWVSLWERVCMSLSCGYVPAQRRQDGAARWWTYGAARLTHPGLHGTKTIHTFRIESSLFEFDAVQETLGLAGSFLQTSDGKSKISGASSFTFFSSKTVNYVVAANFWQGVGPASSSVIYRLDNSSDIGNISMLAGDPVISPALPMHSVQTITIEGARKWQYFSTKGCEFLGVASFSEGLIIYPWNQQANETAKMKMSRSSGASSLRHFSEGNVAYLAVSRFFDGATHAVHSHVYRLDVTNSEQCIFALSAVQDVPARAASDVEYVLINRVHYLVLTSNFRDEPSGLFAWDPDVSASLDESLTTNFRLVQSLPLKQVTSVVHLRLGQHYLALTQEDGDMMLLRWNGIHFLGELGLETSSKDTGGGQRFRNVSARAVAFVTVGESNATYLTAGIWSSDEATSSKSLLWRARREILPPIMNGPKSLVISPDGRFIYVASLFSRSIAVFHRNEITGEMVYSSDASAFGPWDSIRMIQDMVMTSDGNNIYATAYSDNAVVSFGRDAIDGSLHLQQILADGMQWSHEMPSGSTAHGIVDGLVGAYSLALSVTEQSLYVGSLEDRAVVVLEVQSNGLLSFVDRLKEGELQYTSFKSQIDDTTWTTPSSDYPPQEYDALWSNIPSRLGGNAIDRPWTFTAQDVITFTIDGVLYLAVAASDVDPYSLGQVSIYSQSSTNGNSGNGESFATVQELRSEIGVSALAHFTRVLGASFEHYLVVANGFKAQQMYSTINVFQWDSGSMQFVFDHSLETHQTSVPGPLYASSLEYFVIGSDGEEQGFLGVSVLWNGETTRLPSLIFRWDAAGDRMLASGKRSFGTGFKLYQEIEGTMAASDLSFFEFQGTAGLLVVANSQGQYSDTGNGTVGVFEFNSSSLRFQKLQALPAVGAADVEPFSIPGEGDFLAVAHRQARAFVRLSAQDHTDEAIWEDSPSVYDQQSVLWKWNTVEKQFESYQRLGSDISTVSDTGKNVIGRLRGVTSFKMFTSRGEFYLAIAQSVCDALLAESRAECLRHQMQPQSAILQWNRAGKRFGELLSMTDYDNARLRGGRPVDDRDLQIHSFAMRLRAGRAQQFRFVAGATRDLLICASLTRGVLMYAWDFDKAVGFGSIVGVTSDLHDRFVYAVARADDAILAFERGVTVDHIGRPVHTCANDGCLLYVETRSEQELFINAVERVDRYPVMTGLSGALSVSFSPAPGFPRGSIVVHTGMFRDELTCSATAPVPRNVNMDYGNLASCQRVAFEVKSLYSTNYNLFSSPPFIDPQGTLRFQPNPTEVGEARFRVQIRDSSNNPYGKNVGTPLDFSLHILPLNQPPTFEIAEERLEASEGIENVVFFAYDVTAGSERERDQTMTWMFTHDCPNVFKTEPVLRVVSLPGHSALAGSMRVTALDFKIAQCSFYLTLVDSGISSSNGDRNTSTTKVAVLNIVLRNRGPQYEHFDELRIDSSSHMHGVPDFARVISPGSIYETGQSVSFHLVNVTLDGLAIHGLFSSFDVYVNGTLSFQTRFIAIGNYTVTIKADDDGGTERGGVNTTYSSFLLRLMFADDLRPIIVSLDSIELLEADSTVEHVYSNFFYVANLGNVTQSVSLMISDVSNPALFHTSPWVYPDGTLTISLQAYEHGASNLTVTFVVGDEACAASGTSADTCIAANPHIVTISVQPWNRPPSFLIPDYFGSVQDAGKVVVPGFASQIVPGTGLEKGQNVGFHVSVSGGSQGLFATLPRINGKGDLTFEATPGRHGLAALNVIGVDDGELTMNANATSPPHAVLLKVFPRPVVSSVVPRVGPLSGGNTITVVGLHFGSQYSRGFVAAFYGEISIFVGEGKCTNTTFISDQAITCVTPPGVGLKHVSVNISDGSVTRGGFLEHGYAYNLFYLGGTMTQPRSAGFLAHSPLHESAGLVEQQGPSVGVTDAIAAKTVRALHVFKGLVYAGGDFMSLNTADARFIYAWDGTDVLKLENGVDGSVLALVTFREQLIVAGAFTHVFKQWGSVRTGGLAMWDGEQWSDSPMGAVVNGVVTTMATNGTILYVGGRFSSIGSVETDGLAMWDGMAWHALQHEGSSGELFTLAAAKSLLYVAGIFQSLANPDDSSSQVVRWDGGNTGWYSLGEIQGRINCLEVHAESVYAGGDFNRISDVPAANLAVYRAGRWASLGSGPNGAIHALLYSNACLYIGGAFTDIVDDTTGAVVKPATFAARSCRDSSQDQYRFEGLEPFAGMGTVHAMVHATDADSRHPAQV